MGLSADVHAQYVVTLAYNDYYGPYSKGPNPFPVPGVSPVVWQGTNGSGVLGDRGWVSLTLKTTF